MVGKPWSLTANGISLTIRLTPKGGRDAIDGVDVLADGRPVLKDSGPRGGKRRRSQRCNGAADCKGNGRPTA